MYVRIMFYLHVTVVHDTELRNRTRRVCSVLTELTVLWHSYPLRMFDSPPLSKFMSCFVRILFVLKS
jgi:hypothetical protein